MGRKSCFICCKRCLPTRYTNESKLTGTSGTTKENNFVDNQLNVIFLLRKLLEIPEDTCCKLLQHFGNPNLWIECCNSCSNLVEKCQSIVHQIASLEKDYDQLRMDVKYKILKSQKHFDYEHQCETIVRSQIISKDVDYFIKTIAMEEGQETSGFANTENIHDMNPSSDEEYSPKEGNHSIANNVGPLKRESAKINLVVQEENAFEYYFTPGDVDETEELTDIKMMPTEKYSGPQERSVSEINVNPEDLVEEEEPNPKQFRVLKPFDETFVNHSHSNSPLHGDQPAVAAPKKHICSTCGVGFTTAKTLMSHKKSHKIEKLSKCDICGKSFRDNYNYKRHMTIHSNEKPYQCDTCDQRFSRSDLLKRHNRIHTSDVKSSVNLSESSNV